MASSPSRSKTGPATIALPSPMTDLLTGSTLKGTVEVPAYGVMVLRA